MYFADLTPYVYFREAHAHEIRVVNVGWLERGHEFNAGLVEQHLVEKLAALCRRRVYQTRGSHYCGFCEEQPDDPIRVTVDGETLWLGSAETRLDGQDGLVYAAPNLILHYVSVHGYRPPEGFLSALEKWDTTTLPSRHADFES